MDFTERIFLFLHAAGKYCYLLMIGLLIIGLKLQKAACIIRKFCLVKK